MAEPMENKWSQAAAFTFFVKRNPPEITCTDFSEYLTPLVSVYIFPSPHFFVKILHEQPTILYMYNMVLSPDPSGNSNTSKENRNINQLEK